MGSYGDRIPDVTGALPFQLLQFRFHHFPVFAHLLADRQAGIVEEAAIEIRGGVLEQDCFYGIGSGLFKFLEGTGRQSPFLLTEPFPGFRLTCSLRGLLRTQCRSAWASGHRSRRITCHSWEYLRGFPCGGCRFGWNRLRLLRSGQMASESLVPSRKNPCGSVERSV